MAKDGTAQDKIYKMTSLIIITTVPIITGILGYLISKLRNEFAFLGTVINLYYAFFLFIATRKPINISRSIMTINNINFGFYLDQLSGVFIIAVAITSFLLLIYSFRSVRGLKNQNSCYLHLSIIIAITNMMILANNLIFFGVLSFFICIISYVLLISTSEDHHPYKYHTIQPVFLYNMLLLSGILLLYYRNSNITIVPDTKILLSQTSFYLSFLLILFGIFGKLGLIPLHNWTNKMAEQVPVTIYTLIVSIVEKSTGIYILIRIIYYIFNLNQSPYMRLLIIFIAAINIIIAGISALKAKVVYQFLNQNSIVQTGFILLGIGGLNPIALAGGLFHFLNYLAFQPTLLFTAGSYEYWTKTTLLENFQGLSAKMPITFFMILLAILASVGIPPLFGFFSKWTLLQGVFKFENSLSNISSIIALLSFIFGTIITVIYFMKYIRNFSGGQAKYSEKIREPGFTMWLPSIIFSLISVILGVFVYPLSWRIIILPVVQNTKLFSNALLSVFMQSNPLHFNMNVLIIVASILGGILLFYSKPLLNHTRSD